MNGFSICFNSVHFPLMPELNRTDISAEGKEILETLYNSLCREMYSARVPELVAKSLDKSIFACCVPDGFVILRCTINRQMKVFLNGFLLRKDESLKTAWMLARWQILWLCAMEDWLGCGKVCMSLDELNSKVSHASFTPEYYNDLNRIFQQMNNSEVPFSFALTSYRIGKLPLDFRQSVVISMNNNQNIDSGNNINIDRYIYRRTQETEHQFGNVKIELVCLTQKQYLNVVEEMCIDPKNVKRDKAEAKNNLASYSPNELWCFRYYDNETDYYELIPSDSGMYKNLLRGSVLFSDIITYGEGHIVKSAMNYSREKNDYINKQNELKMAAEEAKAQKHKSDKNDDESEAKHRFRKKIEEKGLKGLFHRK
ncbi:MAG: hypothetical protein NC177_12410 [Ruminococcus flavefaciens]|nr:hypothetical protein [Ruminococcus flavefaciens]